MDCPHLRTGVCDGGILQRLLASVPGWQSPPHGFQGGSYTCVARHNAGQGTPHTKGRLPVQLLWSLHDIEEWWRAVATFWAIREVTRQSKLKLANGDREVLARVVRRGETLGQALADAREGNPRKDENADERHRSQP